MCRTASPPAGGRGATADNFSERFDAPNKMFLQHANGWPNHPGWPHKLQRILWTKTLGIVQEEYGNHLWTFKMLVDVYSLHLRFTHVLVGIGSNGFLSISSWTEIQSCPSGHHPKLPFPASVTKAKAHKNMMFLGLWRSTNNLDGAKKHANHEPANNWFYPSTFTA